MNDETIKGRGAQRNVHNKFFEQIHETRDDFLEFCRKEGEIADPNKTLYLETFPKSIVNEVTSPDLGMMYSMNPYQGCEHGCIYCYARNTHEYWGFSAGLDFERRILIKKNAPELLEQKLKSNRWIACPIVLSGNTDCYQPAEKKFEITRKCLKVFLKYKHPVAIITKNALVLRDLDLLKELAKDNLVSMNVSITSLSEDTRRVLEPRTTTIKKRLKVVKTVSELGIPVNAMFAPIIPSINSHEILPMAKTLAQYGANSCAFTIVHLNGAIGGIFTDWIRKAMPDKADKVLNQIRACHGGTLNDSRFGIRKRGEGKIAEQLHSMMRLARRKYFGNNVKVVLNTALHHQYKNGQMKLF